MADADKFKLNCKFKLEIDGITEAHFREVEGLSANIEVLEYQEGGENRKMHKLLGQTRFSNLVLRRGVSDSLVFWKWIETTIQGQKIERKNGAVILLNRDGTPAMRWTFERAWPCRYEGPELDATASGIAIEAIELAHEGVTKMSKG